ncbi:MAG: aldo/keto reductase [Candidatus Bathyarchaeota archaeon]|jgi:aryl-alcohol dehydrogenase-like predicted oxidoreductase|nr:aldo/keto reductase [Candidatus Bathyarchaeota archaeon]
MVHINSVSSRTTLLGSTDIRVSQIGIGTNRWAFGENDEPVFQVYKSLLDNSVNFFDTAEVYTGGKSERLLGACSKRDGRNSVIASKYRPSSDRCTERDFFEALDGSLKRLGEETLDLYYIHRPPSAQGIEALMDYMAEAWTSEKIRAVGVSNFDAEQMRRSVAQLERHGLKLAANQVEYSLLNRMTETNGVFDACKDLNASLVAYRPLGRGQLASAVIAGNSSRAAVGNQNESKLETVILSIAEDHGGSVSQVAINWLLRRDDLVIPIPGATKVDHALENIGALDWNMSKSEFNELDDTSS